MVVVVMMIVRDDGCGCDDDSDMEHGVMEQSQLYAYP